MGAQTLRGMVDSPLDLRTILQWHLRYNHYPGIDPALADSCLRAIQKAARGQWQARVLLPAGYRNCKDRRRTILVSDLVEFCHLNDLVERRRVELFGAEEWE